MFNLCIDVYSSVIYAPPLCNGLYSYFIALSLSFSFHYSGFIFCSFNCINPYLYLFTLSLFVTCIVFLTFCIQSVSCKLMKEEKSLQHELFDECLLGEGWCMLKHTWYQLQS